MSPEAEPASEVEPGGFCLRSPFVVWAAISVPLISLTAAAVGAISQLLLPPPADGLVGIPAGVALALIVVLRARKMSITVDDSGVTLRNFWRRSHYPWQEIRSVKIMTPLGFGGRAIGLSLDGEEGFMSKAPASTATLFGGQYEQRSQLLEILRRLGADAGVPIELRLLRLGVWESTTPEPSDGDT